MKGTFFMLEKIKKLNKKGYIFTKVLKENNIPTVYLTRLCKKGLIKKVASGVYILSDYIEDEFYISDEARKMYLPGIVDIFRKVFVTKEAYCKLLGDFDDEFFKKLNINKIFNNKYEISLDNFDYGKKVVIAISKNDTL